MKHGVIRGVFAIVCTLAALTGCSSDEDADNGSNGASDTDGSVGGGGGDGGGGDGGGGDGGDGGGSASPSAGPRPVIADPSETCPTLESGMVQIRGLDVLLFVGEPRDDVQGPLLFYWHGTGGLAEEVQTIMQPQIDDVVERGGIVASFSVSTGIGETTAISWFTGDFEIADLIVSCAAEQLDIDTRRIFTAGCGDGGFQSGAMVYDRSSYLAGAMPSSGGLSLPREPEDPSHIPAVITTHGPEGVDVQVVDFSQTSAMLYDDIATRGGFAVDCEHTGRVCQAPPEILAAQWQFLNDHPFGFETSPYENGLPDTFPSECKIIR